MYPFPSLFLESSEECATQPAEGARVGTLVDPGYHRVNTSLCTINHTRQSHLLFPCTHPQEASALCIRVRPHTPTSTFLAPSMCTPQHQFVFPALSSVQNVEKHSAEQRR